MRSGLVEAGEAPARARQGGRVLRFNPRRADRAGWLLVETVCEWRGVPIGKLLGRARSPCT
jgi:hypothetical protein